MCKHMSGIDSNQCAMCNGIYDKKMEKFRQIKLDAEANRRYRKEFNLRRKRLQEDTLMTAEKKGYPRTDEELIYVLIHTQDTVRSDVDIFYNLAKKLKRTLGAIEWVWVYAWYDKAIEFIENEEDNNFYKRVQRLKTEVGLN